MVGAIAAPAVAKGVKVGVLIGTAYLFTEEAVATGAIVPRFQGEACAARKTVLLETAPRTRGRVGPSPFADAFAIQRQRLLDEALPPEAIREELERMNAGRLRVAAKGLDRDEDGKKPGEPQLIAVDEHDQYEQGVYMLGQVASLRTAYTIAALHGKSARKTIL